MAKKKGKKAKNQGSSVNRYKKKNVQASKIVKKNLTISAAPEPSNAPSFESKLPYVTPATIMTSSIVAHDNEGTCRRNQEKECTEQTPGFIFMCNGRTKPECYRYRVFGLPIGKLELVEKIKPDSKLFLFDFDLKLLYGIYKATSEGQLGLEPTAFTGQFPAQVKFRIFKECLPLPERIFKEAIKDNYQGSKFRQDLSGKQVKNLVALFCPITAPASATAASTMTNVATPHMLRAQVADKRFQLPARLPPPHGSYSPAKPYARALPVPFFRSELAITHPPYDQYSSEAYVGRVQPHVEPRHGVQQAAHPHPSEPYYLSEAHQPYLPENPSLHILDPHGRRRHNLELVQRDQVPVYGSENHTFQSAENREIGQHSQNVVNYYSQNQPSAPTSLHALVQTNSDGEPSQNMVIYSSQNLLPAPASSQNVGNYYSLNVTPAAASSHAHLRTYAQGEHSQNMVNYYSPNMPSSSASSHTHLYKNGQGKLLSSYQPRFPVTTNEDVHRAYADPL